MTKKNDQQLDAIDGLIKRKDWIIEDLNHSTLKSIKAVSSGELITEDKEFLAWLGRVKTRFVGKDEIIHVS